MAHIYEVLVPPDMSRTGTPMLQALYEVIRSQTEAVHPTLNCTINDVDPIEALLKGASLVVVRHSNVSVDATIAGVPFECEDGAAVWLTQKDYTPENRLNFLRRVAYWQWHKGEVKEAWRFLEGMLERTQP